MPLDDDDKIMIASLIDNAMKAADADAGKLLDGKLSSVLDAVKGCTDAVGAIDRRMTMFENDGARRRIDEQSRRQQPEDASRLAADDDKSESAQRGKAPPSDDDNWDGLPEDERQNRIADEAALAQREGRDPSHIADSARTRFENEIKNETSDQRDRRRDHMMALAQSRADEVFISLGKAAPKPMAGEGLRSYRIRLLRPLRRYSKQFKDVDLGAISDPKVLRIAEESIFADSLAEGLKPTDIGPGMLRMIEKRLEGGHTQRTFHGDPRTWMDQFAGGVQLKAVGKFAVPGQQ